MIAQQIKPFDPFIKRLPPCLREPSPVLLCGCSGGWQRCKRLSDFAQRKTDRLGCPDDGDPDDGARDRFYLSKGHGPQAFYAVLAATGFIDPATLDDFATTTSTLGHHPDRTLIRGVEIGSGSLGHGLPLAIGAYRAIAAKGLDTPRFFVLVGDAELDEGSNMEAIQVAGRIGMDRLTVIVIDNDSSTYGWSHDIGARFEVEGWVTSEVNGRDVDALVRVLDETHDRPHVVVPYTERKFS